jgi:hypothetical protein
MLKAMRMAFSTRFRSSPVRQSDQGTSENRMTPPTLMATVVRMTASRARSVEDDET